MINLKEASTWRGVIWIVGSIVSLIDISLLPLVAPVTGVIAGVVGIFFKDASGTVIQDAIDKALEDYKNSTK